MHRDGIVLGFLTIWFSHENLVNQAGEMPHKPDNLSLIPGIHSRRKELSLENCFFDLQLCIMAQSVPPMMILIIIIIIIHKINVKKDKHITLT